jgi:ribosome-binding protein aMBF1 (putative translation factor)
LKLTQQERRLLGNKIRKARVGKKMDINILASKLGQPSVLLLRIELGEASNYNDNMMKELYKILDLT